jgi:hypothetical protein
MQNRDISGIVDHIANLQQSCDHLRHRGGRTAP